MKTSAVIIMAIALLWGAASNIQAEHRIRDLKLQNQALREMVRECQRAEGVQYLVQQ